MATPRKRSRSHAREAARARARIRARKLRKARTERTVAIASIALGVLVAIVLVIGLVLQQPHVRSAPSPAPSAPPACPQVAPKQVGAYLVPAGPIDGYCQAALVNAALIIEAGQSLNVGERGEEIGVMTAIGESGLRVLNYGDTAGPDSRGLFQQRTNWGTLAERMDPYTSAHLFFSRMIGVRGWNTRPPTTVAHIVQGNANPDYYTPYFPEAVDLVQSLGVLTIPAPTDSPYPVATTTPAG